MKTTTFGILNNGFYNSHDLTIIIRTVNLKTILFNEIEELLSAVLELTVLGGLDRLESIKLIDNETGEATEETGEALKEVLTYLAELY